MYCDKQFFLLSYQYGGIIFLTSLYHVIRVLSLRVLCYAHCGGADGMFSYFQEMPRYDDRYGNTRLYVGRLASRTRSRDLEYLFSRYGR
jgi:hypothetical protein